VGQLRLSALSANRQTFIRVCQGIGHGQINCLAVREAQPVFTEHTEVLIDLKLDGDESPRPEQQLDDYVLRAELVRLFCKFDELRDGLIQRVEIRAGIPRRIVVRTSVPTRK
jgi:hypothetical protein